MPQVPNEAFVQKVRDLLEVSKGGKGSVYFEQKRLTKTGADTILHSTSAPYPLIFRVTNGARKREDRVAVSTVVEAKELQKFWLEFSEAIKKGAAGLRKKDKKKDKKKAK